MALFKNKSRRRVQASSGLCREERILAGIKQSELAIRVVEDGLRDQHPNADDTTIASLLLERIRLMKRIQNGKVLASCLSLTDALLKAAAPHDDSAE